MKLFIIRHGEPAGKAPGEVSGKNPPLSQRGHIQAQRTAERMAAWGIDALYSSTLTRALETAAPIYEATKAPWSAWPSLCETGRKRWVKLRERAVNGTEQAAAASGRYTPLSQLRSAFPHVRFDQPFSWPDEWWQPFRTETRDAAYTRARRSIDEIVARHARSSQRVAVVCHGAFGSVLLTVLTDGTPCDHNRFSHAHAAISLVDVKPDGARVRLVDYVEHLAPDWITQGVDI